MSLRTFSLLAFLGATAIASAQPPSTDSVVSRITDEYVAGAVFRPARVLERKLATMIYDMIGDREFIDQGFESFKEGTGLDPRDVEEIAILLDRKTLYQMARIPVEEDGDDDVLSTADLTNNLKQVLLAAHNFHDVYSHFPDNDGGEGDNKGNLSWRVHLLPFLEGGQQLYKEFHLDEKWDSDHNKALIEKMPDVFKTPGVKTAGHSSVHGIVAENSIMSGEAAVSMRNITDGTSNTLMLVIAGADKAIPWTKPGGLKYQEGTPEKTLGKLDGSFLFGRCDGSVGSLAADLEAETFRRLVTYNDGEVVRNLDRVRSTSERLPSWVVRTRTKINHDSILMALRPMGDPIKVDVKGMTTYSLGEYTLAFVDDQTLVAAPTELAARMLAGRKKPGRFAESLQKTLADHDVAVAIDFSKLTEFKDKMGGQVPMAGLVQGIDLLEASLDVTGTGKFLHDVSVTTGTELAATQLSALMTGAIQMQIAQINNISAQAPAEVPPQIFTRILELYEGVEASSDGKVAHYRMKKPENMDAFLESLQPILDEITDPIREEVKRSRTSALRRPLRQIGLAFHNYHDVYNAFPRFNGDANPDSDEAKRGLSWRVYLLPFLDEAALYQKFKLDEPWDSDANKALIEQMPAVFKVKGVKKPGHTSIHVFIGEDTMFGDGESAPQIRDILDGTSNTFLAVEAGPDTAEIWTKPGGLKFTGENSRKLLGNIAEQFIALMADGSVRMVNKDIDEELLGNLIQNDDGNTVTEF